MKIQSMRFENLTFGYSIDRPIFKDITCEIPVNRILMVEGPPGSGQSTLLKLLAVLHQPNEGSFFVNDKDTSQMSFEEFLPVRRMISYTFDNGGLFANRTLLDNLTLPLLYHKTCSVDEAEAEAKRFAEEFGFQRQLLERPASVSGGLRKLVCTIRSFMQKPEILVMDDPFTGLDTESVKRLIGLIHSRREQGTLHSLFFTSRDEHWPKRLGYDSLLIQNGTLELRENHFGSEREAA
ncbi:MAG: ATP-binding cassette domain-containing protein [Bdellovibrionota bacterium]